MADVAREDAPTTLFCPGCFADESGGSWDHVVVGNHCTNCGSSGTVRIPVWAVTAIRRSASWVGKRFYPADEDHERHRELQALRNAMTTFPGRSVSPAKEAGHYLVTQALSKQGTATLVIEADSPETALALAANKLPWFKEDPSK